MMPEEPPATMEAFVALTIVVLIIIWGGAVIDELWGWLQ